MFSFATKVVNWLSLSLIAGPFGSLRCAFKRFIRRFFGDNSVLGSKNVFFCFLRKRFIGDSFYLLSAEFLWDSDASFMDLTD